MFKRLLPGLALWILITGGSLAWSQTPDEPRGTAAPPVRAPVETHAGGPPTHIESAVDQQMLALDRRARMDMLLYAGQFGQGAMVSNASSLDPIALNLGAGR